MARYLGPCCRICRRESTKLFLKGEKCFTDKCALERRNYAPGQHGQRRRKVSDYGVHLRGKQRIRRSYGLLEKQFRSYFEKAERMPGVTGENLLILLERRLDNVIYRMGFSITRQEARQVVGHGHVLVNDVPVNIPSYLVSPGDKVRISPKAKEHLRIKAALDTVSQRGFPNWVDVDVKNMAGVYKTNPDRKDLSSDFNENLVVELYSK